MKVFLFVSLLFIVIFAKTLYSYERRGEIIGSPDSLEQWKQVFDTSFQKGLFRTTMDIGKNHLTGFIFIKKVSDTSYRILFSNEIGIKFFDLEFSKRELIVHYCFPSLDRKSFLRLLESDFRILFFPNLGIKKISRVKTEKENEKIFTINSAQGKWRYEVLTSSKKILFIGTINKVISKARIKLEYSGNITTGIDISNPMINLSIIMNLISP
jgi:hypothetical protein